MAGVDGGRGWGVDAGPAKSDKAGGGVGGGPTRFSSERDPGTPAAFEGHISVSQPVNAACDASEVDLSSTATILFLDIPLRNWRGAHFFFHRQTW